MKTEDVAAETASGNGVVRHAARSTDYRQARRKCPAFRKEQLFIALICNKHILEVGPLMMAYSGIIGFA